MASDSKSPPAEASGGATGSGGAGAERGERSRAVRRDRYTAAFLLCMAFLASVLVSWQSGRAVEPDASSERE